MNKIIDVHVDKLVFGGQALAYHDGMPVFVWNALPGEDVTVEITKKRKSHLEGIATVIKNPSEQREDPVEPHYLSSSPWAIMSFEQENRYKEQVAQETYERIGKLTVPDSKPIIANYEQIYGYRNKIEFSFFEYDDDDPRGDGMDLAFFQRGKRYKIPVQSSELAEPVINSVAAYILAWINEKGLGRYDVKSLIVRSNGEGKAVAALFVKNMISVDSYPELTDDLLGFHVYFSNPKSPASVPTEHMHSAGQEYLEAHLRGVKLQFGLLGFFQVNIPVFEMALNDIAKWVLPNKPLIDYYSGVGAIGLPLASAVTEVLLVENNEEATDYANKNIESNAIDNAKAILQEAEHMLDSITDEHTVIVDPPRAGLHKDVVERLLEVGPPRILYLSCNLSTQARDIQLLSGKYTSVHYQLYNFFPRTPHIEALWVLDRT